MLCIALMIFSAISFVEFFAIIAASSPVFISDIPAFISVPFEVEMGQVLKRRHLYHPPLGIFKALDPSGHFRQGKQEQFVGCLSA